MKLVDLTIRILFIPFLFISNGLFAQQIEGHLGRPYAAEFDANGDLYTVGGGNIIIWDGITGAIKRSIDFDVSFPETRDQWCDINLSLNIRATFNKGEIIIQNLKTEE